MLPIKVTPVADAHIKQASGWWLANRDKAPHAFKEEFERGFALISHRPEMSAAATNVKLKGVRRIHLARVRSYLFYRVKEGRVEVLALWHSSRKRDPILEDPPDTPLQPTAEELGG